MADAMIEKAKSLRGDRREAWVMERRAVDIAIAELGDVIKPEVLVCISPKNGAIIGATVVPQGNPVDETVAWALGCMLSPHAGRPRRPASVTLTGNSLPEIRPLLEEIGVSVNVEPESHPAVEELVKMLLGQFESGGARPYLAQRGMNVNTVTEFFQAAAEYYRLKPWTFFEYETPAGLVIFGKNTEQYFPVVMGIEGQTLGLTLYRSIDGLLEMFDAEEDEEFMDLGQHTWSLGFSYDAFQELPDDVQRECLKNQWPLASPEAYPGAIVIDPDAETVAREVTNEELTDLTIATLAMTEFLRAHEKEVRNATGILVESVRVTVAGRPVDVGITLPAPGFFEDDEGDEDLGLVPPRGVNFEATSDLERANNILISAYEERKKAKRIELGKKALAVSADCADAYLLLADEAARNDREREELLTQAVKAGRRSLGEGAFQELTGHFWGIHETRPHMRALLSLAEFRRTHGRFDEAIADYQEMLRLNPNDNQAARYSLASALIMAGRDDDLWKLLKEYKETIGAFGLYTQALAAFRKSGKSAQVTKAFAKAVEGNKFVPDYLLGRKPLPKEEPDSYSIGSDEEAVIYVGLFMEPWQQTSGALEWLREFSG